MTQQLTEAELLKKTPQELTSLLYQSALTKLEKAMEAIDEKNYIEANTLLQKCNDILHRLGGGLNYEAGPLAEQLEDIYNYMAEKLIQANLKKNKADIEEVHRLLTTIAQAWEETINKGPSAKSVQMRAKATAYERNLFYED
ncbi:flagellar export chaperone FliS [Heliorestis convoluta]|uniref:Flagellar secretion chaperone FliS n=1 Tax=Heliorestis convoluta TaxID=356322 RepID=A0A5Q2N138_9FIRM|nr:flagellar export chaperone FliS [Heliorestis convoluta]QGG47513.1 flagellar export chaperone FliS [Heliorestis convoluta]